MNDKTQPAMELPALPEPMTVLSDEDIMRSAQGWRQFDAPEGLAPVGHMIYGACRSALNAYYDRARASASSAAVGEQADPLQGAVNWLCQARLDISVDLIQQKLHIGYNRAKRLFDAATPPSAQHEGGA